MARTRARKIREESNAEIRRQLSIRGKAEYIFDTIDKIGELDPSDTHFNNQLAQCKAVLDYRVRMLNKTLPDLKSVEADLTSSDGSLTPPTVIELVAKTLD